MTNHTFRRRLFSLSLAVTLLGSFAASQAQAAFFVRSIATAQTSGNIFDGKFANTDTGKVALTSNSAGPFSVGSGGAFYSFQASANVHTEIGAVHGAVSVSAHSTGPAGGANASVQGFWEDSVTITSSTLPAGTPVQFLATMTLHRTLTGSPPAHASALVNGPFGMTLTDTLDSPNPNQSISTIVNTTVGQVLSVFSTLTLSADAGGIAPFSLGASVDAENTAIFTFEPLTAGASYTTSSGVMFVPEPATAPMLLCGLASLSCFAASRLLRARRR